MDISSPLNTSIRGGDNIAVKNHPLNKRVYPHPGHRIFRRKIFECMQPQRHLSLGLEAGGRSLRNEYYDKGIPAVKADYQEDRNKSCNCETVRCSFFFTQISKAETVLRRSLSFHCHDYSDVPVYMEYRHYRQPVADR